MLSTYTHIIEQNNSLPQIQFSSLNLSSLSISLINKIPTKLMFISQLNLDNNLLVSLNGIEQFMNLEVLTINFNFISQKNHLLSIRNKFLLKELSFVGNQIQTYASLDWLVEEGFTSLEKLNQVQIIGYFAIGRKRKFRQENLTLYRDHTFSKQQDYQQKVQIMLNSPKSKHSQQLDNETKPLHNKSIENSYFLPFIQADMTKRLTKNKQRFESTGDTCKHNISYNRFGQTSKYDNSFDSSPNFNKKFSKFRETFANRQTFEEISKKRKHNISEFRLYPVDESLNSSKGKQRDPKHQNRHSIEVEHKKKPKKIRAFEETQERPYQHDIIQRDSQNRSDKYYLGSKGTRIRTRSDQSDNNIIEREIPVYKQAIAIAFYYRNLLEKVFAGFDLIKNQPKQFPNQQNMHQNQMKQAHRNQSQHEEKFQQKSGDTDLNAELRLKRYAWMKLQLFVNNKKIIDKYTQSLQKY